MKGLPLPGRRGTRFSFWPLYMVGSEALLPEHGDDLWVIIEGTENLGLRYRCIVEPTFLEFQSTYLISMGTHEELVVRDIIPFQPEKGHGLYTIGPTCPYPHLMTQFPKPLHDFDSGLDGRIKVTVCFEGIPINTVLLKMPHAVIHVRYGVVEVKEDDLHFCSNTMHWASIR